MTTTTDARADFLAEPIELVQSFWDRLEQRTLLVNYVDDCDLFQHQPETFCSACGSDDVEWRDTPGLGEVHSFIAVDQGYYHTFTDLIPYNVFIIQLNEGPRLGSNLIGIDSHDVEIEMRVKATPKPVGDRFALFFEKA
jgi:hypothetical protein